jgi:molecular chaperone DnaJ
MSDLYAALELTNTATAEEIKAAHRRLVMQYHPDRNQEPAALEKFKAVQSAYDILSDESKRKEYDLKMATGNPFAGWSDVFAGSPWRNGHIPMPGDDINVVWDVDLESTLVENPQNVTVHREDNCTDCNGKKLKAGCSDAICVACGGRGKIERTFSRMNVKVVEQRPCGTCNGQGRYVPLQSRCEGCQGSGVKKNPYTINFTIPSGIESERTFVARGHGNVGRFGGARGNVLIRVNVRQHPKFKRSASNPKELLADLTLSFVQICLGGETVVETIDGYETVNVQPCLQPGSEIRIPNKGLPSVGGSQRGDLILTLKVAVPATLTDKQKQLIQQLAELEQS